ncbi:copper homeostasis protein CutC [Nocardioides limicola]|uniref:copper homeostasis protein CutC n=1 Tax=Nocardioides limicola TaxID=2803368 RepID=UPI00193B6029|nr:copper homeostasis protein CutC [Nocardioides sp. DJM-14]
MSERGLLEVAVLRDRDVAGAVAGGADRLLVGRLVDSELLTPELATVTLVCRESDVPVRVVLRLGTGWTTNGGELTRLIGLAHDALARGAESVEFGFLDADLQVDAAVCRHLATQLGEVAWSFSPAIDAVLEPQRAWSQIWRLPGLDGVRSAGSPRGMGVGYDDLLALVEASPQAARLLIAGEGLTAEQVPWLWRAGVRQFHLGRQSRPGGSLKADVAAEHVRSWRLLLDHAAGRG